MTRATLLNLLAHPTALTGADVRALEALAETFPYCQTAHLLLAKAAHDQDSMLAGQRLRRAATYAADRTLLRQLIEQQPAVAEEAVAAAATTGSAVATQGSYASAPAADPAVLAAAEPPAIPAPRPLADYPTPELLAAPVAPEAPTEVAAATAPVEPEAPADTAPAAPELTTQAAVEATPPAPNSPASLPADQTPAAEVAPEPASEAAATPAPEAAPDAAPAEAAPAQPITEAAPESAAPLSPAEAAAPTDTAPEPPVTDAAEVSQAAPDATDPAPEQLSGPAAATHSELPAEPELPPQAPPVRPPEQAEAARHEFGLAPPEAAELAPYRLPGLELELAITIPLAAGPATPRLPAFGGVPDVAYAPGEGSRLGFCLVPSAVTSEAVPDQVPPSRLPPAGEFFAPDALLTEYVAAPPAPAANPLDLIDSFLQRNAAAPRRRPQVPALGQQADLSARSTRAVPELASESLALILVRQGKIEQAIVIYERLMVKNPEKVAYFAAQIDQLRPSA